MTNEQHTAVVTGASQGLGYELAGALVARGWQVIVDARTPGPLDEATGAWGGSATAIAGDVNEPAHRRRLVDAVRNAGRLDLLVNNASTIGASPMPTLAEIDVATLRTVYDTNVIAPLSLTRAVLPYLVEARGIVVNISSDAAVEPYEGWGGYGPSKAALDHATAILAQEQPEIRAYAFDPGDMRTALHQAAFPDDDISDRPEAATVVPALLRLVDERPGSARVTAADLAGARGVA
ncbi:SDR family NAD(P)-dependent oxidoreductase [Solicola gregarius]|uniref:SDR family oxidoreductase n=1 Tax=Solicola gregarius TaxID=2908642 RepID=A0AA46TK50_9ACTN|nr:SDR family NAD(P)-dependent oxidoreductase [Solicola gregarius]UYM06603.1 SDR family oxidoreductase [Solicola gregarius]